MKNDRPRINQTKRPSFLNSSNTRTFTNNISKGTFTIPFGKLKPKKPSFLNKSFIATKTIVPQPGYVFKTGNKGLGMYANNKTTNVVGPVQGPVGPKAV